MLKVFSIHEEGKPEVGTLTYDTEKEEFTLRVNDMVNKQSMPFVMEIMFDRGIQEVNPELSMCFVRERIFPPDRAGISTILADLGMLYYDEYIMLAKLKGRCVMDNFLVEPTFNEI